MMDRTLLGLTAILTFLATSSLEVSATCATAERCCPGRDSSCMVSRGYGGGVCYCDEGCLETGDCCRDYKQICGVKVVDCQVTAWSIWSSCNASCGKGTQSRTRLITAHPSPTGAPCGPLEQNRSCMGRRCDQHYWKYKNAIRETAGLLPAKYFKKQRAGKSTWDVRENLFQRSEMLKRRAKGEQDNSIDGYLADQPDNGGSMDYCIVFELTKVAKACLQDKDFLKMEAGRQMCALCPSDARRKNLGDRCRGHGVDSRLTRWRSTVKSTCHGKWRRVYETRNCPCQSGADFIFV